MLNITKKICTNWNERSGHKPEIIVVHISAGSMSSMTSWFHNEESQVSAHYGVSKTGEIIQYVEENKCAWANGRVNKPTFTLFKPDVNPNKYTISIENEGNDLSEAPETQLNTLAHLIKDISIRYNIPIDRDHIIGHYQIDGLNKPYCPSHDHSIMDKIVERVYNIKSTEEIINLPNNNMAVATTSEIIGKIITNKRFKSFYWRTGMMCLAIVIQQLIAFVPGLGLSATSTIMLGLILGECSKAIANALKE